MLLLLLPEVIFYSCTENDDCFLKLKLKLKKNKTNIKTHTNVLDKKKLEPQKWQN